MSKTLQQIVRLQAPPEELYDTYLDPVRHAELTGSRVTVRAETGTVFEAFDGSIIGRLLHLVPGRMIVQTWRASSWPPEDLDSILVLTFSEDPAGARVDLVHAEVPAHAFDDVTGGWERFYWSPWRRKLKSP